MGNISSCQECKEETKIIRGEEICTGCGLVLGPEILSSDYHSDTLADKNLPGGMPLLPKKIGIGHLYSHEERQYSEGKLDIELLSNYLSLSPIMEKEALDFWKQCIQNEIIAGRNQLAIIGACVYLAALMHGKTIRLEDLEEFAKRKEIQHVTTVINSILKLRLNLPFSPEGKIWDYGQQLNYPEHIIKEAVKLYVENSFPNRSISTVLLGILYYLSKKNVLNITLIHICRIEEVRQEYVKKVSTILEEQNGKN